MDQNKEKLRKRTETDYMVENNRNTHKQPELDRGD